MADLERLTITLPSDMAAVIKGAIADGDYASTSEVVREALRNCKTELYYRRGYSPKKAAGIFLR